MQPEQLPSMLPIGQAILDVQQGAFVQRVQRREVHDPDRFGKLARRRELLSGLPEPFGALASLRQRCRADAAVAHHGQPH